VGAERVTPLAEEALADAIRKAADEVDGIAVVALDCEPVRKAINYALSQDVKVVSIVSDIEFGGRVPYVGVDNYRAGRCAGNILARFAGKRAGLRVAILQGGGFYRAHRARENGFVDSIREEIPDVNLEFVQGVRNENKNSFRVISERFRTDQSLHGIYNVGAANRGIVRAIRERPIGMEKPIFVAHELTPHTRLGIQDQLVDAIVAQDPYLLVDGAIRHLLQLEQKSSFSDTRNGTFPTIYVRDNI